MEAVGEVIKKEVINSFNYSDDFYSVEEIHMLVEKYAEKMHGKTLTTAFQQLEVISHILGKYYADTMIKGKREFQEYVRKNPLVIKKADLIEAETILDTELIF